MGLLSFLLEALMLVYLHLLDPPFANQLDTCSQMT